MERPSTTEDAEKKKQLSKTTLTKEIAILHSYRGDPAMPTSKVPSLDHFCHAVFGTRI